MFVEALKRSDKVEADDPRLPCLGLVVWNYIRIMPVHVRRAAGLPKLDDLWIMIAEERFFRAGRDSP